MKMKTVTTTTHTGFIAVIYLLAFNLFSTCEAIAYQNVGGYFITRTGQTLSFIGLSDDQMEFAFRYGPEKNESSVPFSSINRVVFGEKARSALLELKDGRVIDCLPKAYTAEKSPVWHRHSGYRGEEIQYTYYDDIARAKKSRTVYFRDIAEIRVDSCVGRFRVCPHCHAIWSDSFLFCPKDGVATVWGEASTRTQQAFRPSPEEVAARRSHVLQAVINESLAHAGVDPQSDCAEYARDLSLLWMNPLAKPEEIQQKMNMLRDSILRQDKAPCENNN